MDPSPCTTPGVPSTEDAGTYPDGSAQDGVLDAGAAPDDAAPGVGATVPFTTHEAEDMTTNVDGGAIVMSPTPNPLPSPIPTATLESLAAIESSGRAFVSVVHTGEYVELKVTASANRFVVRFSVPDGAGGGGIDTQIGLYVNGTRQTLPLSSAHAWLYGPANNDNTPSDGSPHRFWDEAQAVIPNVGPGDTVRLQRDGEDTTAFYWIDLVDLEQATKAEMPSNAVSVETCSGALEAVGADAGTFSVDASSLSTCLNQAAAEGKSVFFPEGRYIQDAKIQVPADGGVIGAGMWFTTFYSSTPVTDFGGPFGFNMNGANGLVSDLKLDTTGAWIALGSRRSRGLDVGGVA